MKPEEEKMLRDQIKADRDYELILDNKMCEEFENG